MKNLETVRTEVRENSLIIYLSREERMNAFTLSMQQEIVKVLDDDNSAEHSIDVAYSKYLGWIDAPRKNPLTWIFIILTLITLTVVISVASKTSLDFSDGALQEDFGWENDEDEENLDDIEEDY